MRLLFVLVFVRLRAAVVSNATIDKAQRLLFPCPLLREHCEDVWQALDAQRRPADVLAINVDGVGTGLVHSLRLQQHLTGCSTGAKNKQFEGALIQVTRANKRQPANGRWTITHPEKLSSPSGFHECPSRQP